MDENKKIEVVNGDGSNLNISPAYDHLNAGTPTPASQKPKNIVVPKSMKEKEEEENKDKEEKDENDSNKDENNNK